MRRYEKYKDSGIDWIGEIPEHWEVDKLGWQGYFSASGIDKKSVDGEPSVNMVNYTDIYGNEKRILTADKEYMIVSCPEEKAITHQVLKGDLLFTPSSETIEDIGLSALVIEDLPNTVFSYHVIRLEFTKDFDLGFRKYLCNNNFVLNQFSREAKGTTRQIIGRDVFKKINIVIPPFVEQTAIAKYLDRKTQEIDQLIKQKEELLLLFEEEKIAIINHAITKGINPNAKLKDSKIEWLGEIPEHWGIIKIKYISNYFKGFAFKSTDFADSGIPIVKASNIKNKQIEKITSFINNNNQRQEFEKVRLMVRDIIVSTVGSKPDITESAVGQIGIINEEFSGSYLNQNTLCIRPLTIVDDRYLKFVFMSKSIRSKFDTESSWIANQAYLEVENILDIYVPFPSMAEQLIIAKSITESLERINKIVLEMNRLILLLKEFKTALISEVATGKIKVN